MTIRNCWHKAGILPSIEAMAPGLSVTPSIPISTLLSTSAEEDGLARVERQLEGALDELVATGALQPGNQMDIATLLSPANESNTMDESTDREIYKAVMVAREAHENMEINGGDDIDEEPVERMPSCKDVLKATSVIRRFVDDMNDPLHVN